MFKPGVDRRTASLYIIHYPLSLFHHTAEVARGAVPDERRDFALYQA